MIYILLYEFFFTRYSKKHATHAHDNASFTLCVIAFFFLFFFCNNNKCLVPGTPSVTMDLGTLRNTVVVVTETSFVAIDVSTGLVVKHKPVCAAPFFFLKNPL